MKNSILGFIIFVLFICAGGYMFVSIGEKSGHVKTEIVESTTTDITTDSSTNNVPQVNTAVKNTVKKPNTTNTTNTTKSTTKTATTINYIKIGQKTLMGGVYITPTKVTYDSRCPVDVKCVQAGTVELGVLLVSGNQSQNVIIVLGKPFAFDNKQITLNSVAPAKYSGKTIQEADYKFNISIK